MSTSELSGDHSAADATSSPGAGFRKLFNTGVLGMLVGMAGLFGASWIFAKPESASIALMWTVSHLWIAFAFGLVFMVVVGLVTKAPLSKPLLAYVLPVAVLAAIAGICLAIFPDSAFRSDFLAYLPGVWVFYLFSGLWLSFRGGEGGAFQRAVIPSLVGGVMIVGFVAAPTFASDAFVYRSAFHLTNKETKVANGVLTFEGELEITKAGNYEFTAPRYILTEELDSDDTGIEFGEIKWGAAGAPKEGAIGKFPLHITWKRGVEIDPSGALSSANEFVSLDVSRPDQEGKLIYSIQAESATEP